MARTLTKKQRQFVNEYADTGNGTQAALKAYDVKNAKVASVVAAENLAKPSIQAELEILGFDSNTAKRVVGEILSQREVEPQHRLKAADLVFKVQGDFAAEKHLNVNVEVAPTDSLKELADALLHQQTTT